MGSLHLSSVPTTLSSLCGLSFGNTRGPQIAATSSGIHPVQAGHKNHLRLCWMREFSPSCRSTATQGPAGAGQAETHPSPTRAASTHDEWGGVKQGQGTGQHQHLQAAAEVYRGQMPMPALPDVPASSQLEVPVPSILTQRPLSPGEFDAMHSRRASPRCSTLSVRLRWSATSLLNS